MRVLIIIPAYNEEKNIVRTMEDITTNLRNYDYLIVNDCSSDQTSEVLDSHRFSHIDLPINLGLSGAVQTGYQYAYNKGYDCAVQFDGDGQHQAKYISSMVNEIANGADIVIGSRFIDAKRSWGPRMLGSRILSALIKLRTNQYIHDPTSGMRMLNRTMLHDYAFNINREPEPDTLVYEMNKGAQVKEIQVSMNNRLEGESMFSGFWPAFKYMMLQIVSIIFLS